MAKLMLILLFMLLIAAVSASTTGSGHFLDVPRRHVSSFRNARSAVDALLPADLDTTDDTSVKAVASATISTSLVDSKTAAALKLLLLFVLWYGFNAGYNVYNAYIKQEFHYPWTTSGVQLFVGLFYAIPLWLFGARKMPRITVDDLLKLLPIAMLNAGGHVSAVNAMFEKGGGSFLHVIKASEPVVSAILNLFVNGIVPKPLTALSLLPITYGVAYASTLGKLDPTTMNRELTTKAAKLAMTSNVAFSLRSILRKNLPADFQSRTNLDPANECAVTMILSLLLMIPFTLYFESVPAMKMTISNLVDPRAFFMNVFVCGMCFYLYNEMQNVVLGSLGPVPTAVGNTLKRVVIFVALYLFTTGETFPFPKVLGCAIAIAGCFAFAVFDSKKI